VELELKFTRGAVELEVQPSTRELVFENGFVSSEI